MVTRAVSLHIPNISFLSNTELEDLEEYEVEDDNRIFHLFI